MRLLVGHGLGAVVIRWYKYRHASRGRGDLASGSLS